MVGLVQASDNTQPVGILFWRERTREKNDSIEQNLGYWTIDTDSWRQRALLLETKLARKQFPEPFLKDRNHGNSKQDT